jgi:hypothetical protein
MLDHAFVYHNDGVLTLEGVTLPTGWVSDQALRRPDQRRLRTRTVRDARSSASRSLTSSGRLEAM